jgi:hypothetical protein
MTKLEKLEQLHVSEGKKDLQTTYVHRRRFLQSVGIGIAGVSLIAAGCKKEERSEGIYLGSGDVGLLNFAYVLEQLEAAFYTQVTQTFYNGITDAERALLNDIKDHEIAHREFLKNALGDVAIPTLDFNFSTINFSDRMAVLESAKLFEDVGVSAYNGSGLLFTDEKFLMVAAKIVSVEARHAALVRDLISEGSFASAEVIDTNGLERSRLPKEVLDLVSIYITTIINFEDLPTA